MRIIGQAPARSSGFTAGHAVALALLGSIAAAGIAELVAPASHEPDRLYVIEATTAGGHVYYAGSGSDCASAWQGAVMPGALESVICIKAR